MPRPSYLRDLTIAGDKYLKKIPVGLNVQNKVSIKKWIMKTKIQKVFKINILFQKDKEAIKGSVGFLWERNTWFIYNIN